MILQKLAVPFHPVIGNHEYKLTPDQKLNYVAQAETISKQSTGLETYFAGAGVTTAAPRVI